MGGRAVLALVLKDRDMDHDVSWKSDAPAKQAPKNRHPRLAIHVVNALPKAGIQCWCVIA